ncbi:MAG: hypothetical protein JWR69_3029 [Pedosphaera sp.]|nr:hypothetical protein [Pedosphaera sp.]
MKKLLLFLMVVAVYVLHQDYWNWKNAELVFGFLPTGLAYHAGYSVLASIMMAVLVKFAWPKHLEDVEPHEPVQGKPEEERH